MKKVVGYVRVSSDSQIENTSIEEQVKRIAAYCISQEWELIEIFKDEGFSGSNTNRPGYKKMMEYLSNHKEELESVVVLKMDRAHRNQLNLLQFIKVELAELNMDFVSITESFDTSTMIGRMMLGILSTFGEFEREVINERTKSGRLSTALKNEYAGGQVPYGYVVENGAVKINKEQAAIVKHVFDEFIEGRTCYRIAKKLNEEGIKTKSNKNWTPTTIRRMLDTESYTGFNSYNGSKEQNAIRQKDVFPKIISRQKWNKIHAAVTA
ncbi:recombinase family protein [Priestia megaterium]|uniref:recombinase family protein n=1 Tax=Priestia megaterium TaxID=1404 RepID=UPI000BF665FC|nr:recombinase family protein [Priestia megaterium]PFW00303.1 recombinase family protein [Priestia megaterium]